MAAATPVVVLIGQAAVATGVAYLSGQLLKPKPKNPVVDNKPSTTSSRGSYVPLLVGRRRVGVAIAFVGDRAVSTESTSGEKKATGTNNVYRESAHHILCVGPGYRLYKIWSNGKVIYAPVGGLTATSEATGTYAPSGTLITIAGVGSFRIYWGEQDSPVDVFMGQPARMGAQSRWKFAVRISWESFKLGNFPSWPSLEYDIEVRPYKPGTLTSGNYNSLPDRLSNSVGWVNNGLGADPTQIHNIRDGYDSLEVPSNGGTIKIGGNQTSVFLTGTRAKVVGQPYPTYSTILLNVVSASYNAGEAYYTPLGYSNFSSQTLSALTNATEWIRFNLTPAVITDPGTGSNIVPVGATVYTLTKAGSAPNKIIYNNDGLTDPPGVFAHSRYRNRLSVYVYRFGESGFDNITIGFESFATSGTPATSLHSHSTTFSVVGGIWNIENTNGAKGKITVINANYIRLDVLYVMNHGADPSTIAASSGRKFFIDISNNTSSVATIGFNHTTSTTAPGLNLDGGTQVLGVTTLDFVQPLVGVDDAIGTIQVYRKGLGAGGANAAHLIHQLLFETYPHGVGLDTNNFDIPSLEAVGESLSDEDGEGLRTHCYAPNGDQIEGSLGAIFQDVGLLCAWDRTTGKFVFTLVRDPTLLVDVPHIPTELIAPPIPEKLANREATTLDKSIFGFTDYLINWRDNAVVVDDDGRASIDQNQKGEVVQLPTVIDADAATQIAERRGQEVLSTLTKFQLTTLRDAGDLYPGQVCTAEGFDGFLLVLECDVDPMTRRVILDVMANTYSHAIGTSSQALIYLPPDPPEPSADLATQIFELPPALLNGSARALTLLRIRAVEDTEKASIYLSPDDITYTEVATDSPYVTGGILFDDIPNNFTAITTGPVIYALGPDILELSRTLSNDDWLLGRQLLIWGTEVSFLQEVVPLGNGYYRLDGILRGKLRTQPMAHNFGDTVFIVDPKNITRIYDPLIKDGQDIYAKTRPRNITGLISLAEVTPVLETIAVGGPTNPHPAFAETPTGTIDGINDTFVLSAEPNPPESLMLFKDGIYMTLGEDYTLSGDTITFEPDAIPTTGQRLTVGYFQEG